jgi:tetratricopeptide (TPR) repeat protein
MRLLMIALCCCALLGGLFSPVRAEDEAWQAAMEAGKTAQSAGKNPEAVTAFRKAVELSTAFAKEDDRVNDCYTALAKAYQNSGQNQDAELQISQLLTRRIRAVGIADPRLATTYFAIGDYYLSYGSREAAKLQFDRAFSICTKAYGEGDARLAPCYQRFADYFRRQNEHREAVTNLQIAIALIEKGGGKESAELGKPLTALAGVFANLRTFPEAEAAYTRALAVQEKAYGATDPRMVETLQAIGAYYWYTANKPEQALPLYQRALAIQEKALKPEDPLLLGTLYNIASLTQRLRQFETALTLYQRLLAARTAADPLGRPALQARMELAFCLAMAKKTKEAETEFTRLLADAAKAPGTDTSSYLRSYYRSAAQAFHNAGNLSLASDAYKRWLEYLEKNTGTSEGRHMSDSRWEITSVLTGWAQLYCQFGKGTEAEPLLQRVLTTDQAQNNGRYANYSYLLTMAECKLALGKVAEAEKTLKDAEPLCAQNNNTKFLQTAQGLARLCQGTDALEGAAPLPRVGRTLKVVELELAARKASPEVTAKAQEHFAAAEPLLKAAKEQWDSTKREDYEYGKQATHYQNALAMSNYAAALIVQGKFAEAKPLLAKAREVAEAALPTLMSSRSYGRSTNGIGEMAPILINQATLRYRELQAARGTAQEVLADVAAPLEKALAEREECYGTDSPLYGTVLIHLGTAYATAGETAKAKKALIAAKALFEGVLGKEHPAVATIAGRLEKIK